MVISSSKEYKRKWDIVWKNVIFYTLLHIVTIYGFYLMIFKGHLLTAIWIYAYGILGGMGITVGAHRLWSHRSYKAKLPLQVILMLCNCISVQNTILDWARNHRMHHRYSETDADPHNAKRGFFFSHIGWLMVRKHPDIKANGHTIEMNDLTSDPVLQFQKKYYTILALLMGLIVPMLIPTLWGETLWNCFFICVIYRFTISLNHSWLVNSAAHMWGNRPYDKQINPTDNNLISIISFGEVFHNYHHTYPWDYKAAELGNYSLNIGTLFIDLMAQIGWAYDLKTVPREIIKRRIERINHVKLNEKDINSKY